MKRLLLLLAILFASAPAAAAQYAPFNPVADYVTPGQDEPGYRYWVAAAPYRSMYVRAFNDYLVTNGVGGVAPTWQLLRTASDWQKCNAQPFEVPPTTTEPRPPNRGDLVRAGSSGHAGCRARLGSSSAAGRRHGPG